MEQHEQPQLGQAVLGGEQGPQLRGVLHHEDPRPALHTRARSVLQTQSGADTDRDASAMIGEYSEQYSDVCSLCDLTLQIL